jgi:hypothetical protein
MAAIVLAIVRHTTVVQRRRRRGRKARLSVQVVSAQQT